MLRGMLRTAEVPYTWAVRWRNRRYDRGQAEMHRASVPVVSIGNLTLGGTGKTPLVKWIARQFIDQGLRVAIVSRGYGAKQSGEANDEARELAESLPDVPHVQNPDRVAAARKSVEEHGCQILLLDDGFQHRRLARDLDIAVVDALEPFGFDHVFPRGTLREPVEGLTRAHVVCLSRADVISATERDAIRRRVEQLAPQAAWCELAHVASELRSVSGECRPLAELAGQRVFAFCGIGNPAGFRHTLSGLGCEVCGWREFPDHHLYMPVDFKELTLAATACDVQSVLCTHKDLVKLGVDQLGQLPLWAVTVDIRPLVGEETLVEEIQRVAQTASA